MARIGAANQSHTVLLIVSEAAPQPVVRLTRLRKSVLFGKLKLLNCANSTWVENRSGFLFVWSDRRATSWAPGVGLPAGRPRGPPPLRLTIPTVVRCLIFVVIRAHSRRFVVALRTKFPALVNFIVLYNEPS
jgi:hypothetical protein